MDFLTNQYTERFFTGMIRANQYPCLGFITGPILMIVATAQIALNLVGALFMALPSICIDSDHPLHAKSFLMFSAKGLLAFFMGVIMFIPFSSCVDTWKYVY